MEPIQSLLQEKQIPHDILSHPEHLRTAQEGADYLGIELGQTAPTLILATDNGYVALIVSGARGRVRLEEIAAILGVAQVKLAPPRDVLRITGYRVGSVPLVGLELPCILDRALFRFSSVYGGTGHPASTLKLHPEALEQLNRVVAYLD
ncbi:aminoacyl-tRNA deacylase [Brevibacillus fluminis]|uniref:aminoacyl-tRNA deacylase n=1 Tax=Brevibacillus fluminis TaxID=511487 RepID=UPI003F8C4670